VHTAREKIAATNAPQNPRTISELPLLASDERRAEAMASLDLKVIQEWIVPLSTAVTLLSTAVAAWVGVCQYRLKVQAERRLQESSQAEVDVKLSKLFAEFMRLAHARGEGYVSDKCIEKIFEHGIITKEDLDDPDSLKRKIAAICTLNLPVGVASQNAAIASLGVLGHRYPILREPARAGLNTLKSFKAEEAERALTFLDHRETSD
jgi:hypothetical protein